VAARGAVYASPNRAVGAPSRTAGSGPTTRARVRDPADLGALLGLSIAALLVGEVGGITTCPWAGLIGIPCPGCGLTRATWALASGRLADAVALHPFVLLALPALGVALGVVLLRRTVAEAHWLASPQLVRVGERAAVAIALAMIALWIARFLGACGGPVAVDPWLR